MALLDEDVHLSSGLCSHSPTSRARARFFGLRLVLYFRIRVRRPCGRQGAVPPALRSNRIERENNNARCNYAADA